MKALYPQLAWNSICKNSRYYVPYIIAGAMMVMMFYIMNYLNASIYVASLLGGSAMQMVFGLGLWVITVFAFIYLFYTNSFLIRVRDRELGIYSILGMNRKNILTIIAMESILVYGIVIASGLFCGIGLSKVVELCLAHLVEQPISLAFTIDSQVLSNTLLVFTGIYGFLFLWSALKISTTKALDLVHGGSLGEKQPKANWLIALVGLILLGVAYYLAVTIEDPIVAMSMFFIAVIMVIIATYLLFIAGSIVLCRILQNNKNYYYHPNHYISVSTMRFRMKRNGAGLASICILMTMVLVMSTMSSSMYIGLESSLEKAYPTEVMADISYTDDPDVNKDLKDALDAFMNEKITGIKDAHSFDVLQFMSGSYTQDGYMYDPVKDGWTYNELYIIDVEDYNAIYGESITLKDGQGLLCTSDQSIAYDNFRINDLSWEIIDTVNRVPVSNGAIISPQGIVCLVVNDLNSLMEAYSSYREPGYSLHFISDVSHGGSVNVTTEDLFTMFREYKPDYDGAFSLSFRTKSDARAAYLQLYGGFLIVCVLLGIIFLVSTVMIIYYKQISEGFEDQKRFEILRKVGMTDQEIRKSINSQVLVLFFTPLLAAGIHLCASWPMVSRILILVGMSNRTLSLIVTAAVYLIFAVFYGIVYKLTSNTYFRIVYSGN